MQRDHSKQGLPTRGYALAGTEDLPHQATTDQLKAVQDVKRDMESDRPMDRLVCGDVGFGKTEVAFEPFSKPSLLVNTLPSAPITILPTTTPLKERFAPTQFRWDYSTDSALLKNAAIFNDDSPPAN